MPAFDSAQGFAAGLSALPTGEMAQQQAQQSALKTAQMRLNLQNELKYQQMLQNMPTGQPGQGGVGNTLMGLAGAALKAGLPQGVQLYTAAVNARAKLGQMGAEQIKAEAAQNNARTNQARMQLTQHQQQANAAYGMLQGVHDQASWEDFATKFARMTGDQEYLGMPYDPSTVQGIMSEALTAKGQVDMALKKLQMQEMQSFRTSELKLRELNQQLQQSRLALDGLRVQAEQTRAKAAEAQAARLAKTGKPLAVPDATLLKQSKNLLAEQYPNLRPEDVTDATFNVASTARQLMSANPGMNADTALRQAAKNLHDDLTLSSNPWGQDQQALHLPGSPVGATFKTPQDVAAAYHAGKLPRWEAEQFLRAMGLKD